MERKVLQLDVSKKLRDFELKVKLALPHGVSVLLGPSGHGKTTILNLIAGIHAPDHGAITLGGQVVFDSAERINVPMEHRKVGFVFQDFALFPHMTVFENVAYGLRSMRIKGEVLKNKVMAELERLEITNLARAKPSELSAGQRQRVALARTLAIQPKALLLDEPLSALDMRLRAKVRGELRQLLCNLGIPTVMVTHDPLDAVSMGDQVVVMESGRVVQIGTYEDLLSQPKSTFVADFVESNAYTARMALWSPDGESIVRLNEHVALHVPLANRMEEMMVVVHPWDITIAKVAGETSQQNEFVGVVKSISNLRDRARLMLDIGVLMTAEVGRTSIAKLDINVGDSVIASFKATAIKAAPIAQ
jgi:molybdate transport system ATP-binding protein